MMGRFLVPATMVAALVAFAVAAATTGLTPYRPAWWPAAVALAILGGITPMIYAVNVRIVPVFARRTWPSATWLRVQIGLALSGAWTVYAARIGRWDGLETVGQVLALGGGIAFTVNIVRLFRQPAPPAPAASVGLPAGQPAVDRLARRFTRLAGVYLLVGLLVGVWTSVEAPATGRWDLVWAHALLVGFFLSMACGVCYHVLARWTERPWRAVWPVRLHLWTVAVGLPAMLAALAAEWDALFLIAGPLQAAAIALFLATVAPFASALPGPTRPAFGAALAVLLVGVGLGATFAIWPEVGARLRQTHAALNLFGWTGLLVTGFGYYLAPRFAGKPLRWPALVGPQLGALGGGVSLGAVGLWWRAYGDAPAALIAGGNGLVALGFVLFAVILAGTFRGQAGGAAATATVLRLRLDDRSARPVRASNG
jgi:hypothetical protein